MEVEHSLGAREHPKAERYGKLQAWIEIIYGDLQGGANTVCYGERDVKEECINYCWKGVCIYLGPSWGHLTLEVRYLNEKVLTSDSVNVSICECLSIGTCEYLNTSMCKCQHFNMWLSQHLNMWMSHLNLQIVSQHINKQMSQDTNMQCLDIWTCECLKILTYDCLNFWIWLSHFNIHTRMSWYLKM